MKGQFQDLKDGHGLSYHSVNSQSQMRWILCYFYILFNTTQATQHKMFNRSRLNSIKSMVQRWITTKPFFIITMMIAILDPSPPVKCQLLWIYNRMARPLPGMEASGFLWKLWSVIWWWDATTGLLIVRMVGMKWVQRQISDFMFKAGY